MGWVVTLSLIFSVLGLLAWRIDGKQETTYGSAGWSRVWPLFKSGLFKERGLRVGDWLGQLSVYYDGIHSMTFGPSGSGKGIYAIIQNLIAHTHIFAIDPGGENTAIACKAWRDRGIRFFCINIFGMFTGEPWALPTHRFNPLDLLDPRSPTFAADCRVIAEMLVPRGSRESGQESYFKNAATTAIRAFIVHIVTSEPKKRRNLATLYDYANCDEDEWESLLDDMRANPAGGGLVRKVAKRLARTEVQSDGEFSGIISTIQEDLEWLADPLVQEGLSRSDIDFSILKKRKGGVISVVLPLEYVESHAAITRLAMSCVILTIQRAPLAKNKILFVIDEAAALGKILRFPNWLATLRKYRVTIWSIWQNVGQVVDLYDRNWQTLISNCGLLQILGAGDPQTAEYTQKILGQCTVNTESWNAKGERSVSQTGRPLLFPDELMRLEKGKQIDFIGNERPAKLNNTAYWKRPELAGSYNPNPYWDGKVSKPSPGDRIKAFTGRCYYALVWWMAPHPIAACIISAPVVYYGWQIIRGVM